jgi:hypothetical protein
MPPGACMWWKQRPRRPEGRGPGCRTTAAFYRERQYLVRRGIPWELLLDHRGLGRADLRF